jgi:hypothetical protein
MNAKESNGSENKNLVLEKNQKKSKKKIRKRNTRKINLCMKINCTKNIKMAFMLFLLVQYFDFDTTLFHAACRQVFRKK